MRATTKNGTEKATGVRMMRHSTTARLCAARLLAVAAAASPGFAHAAQSSHARVWFQDPATSIAAQQINLHNYILAVCVVIFVGVMGIMFYTILKHRKSVGHQAAQFHENTIVEIVWTVIPFLILVFMAYPATKAILHYKDTAAPDITIKVTGYQWKWGYDYLQEGFGFYSNLSTPLEQRENRAPKGENYLLEVDNPLVVPVDTKVRALITAADVIHAWWVPAFGVKQDAIPGFVRDVWFRVDKPGVYRGQCAEICGKEHAFMPIVVDVRSKEDYAKWAAEQKAKVAPAAEDPNKKWELDELITRGQRVYASNCVACHQANGRGVPNAFPGLDGSRLVRGPKAAHVTIVLHGKEGTAMPAFTQLSDIDVAAVVTYERNAWSNKTGDTIQPSEVRSQRK
jgi:cytochrome c oxidase subunit II